MVLSKNIPVAKAIMLVMAVVWCGCLALKSCCHECMTESRSSGWIARVQPMPNVSSSVSPKIS
jgi:hypothetical protein